MIRKQSFLGLVLCFLSITSSFSVLGNPVSDQLQAIYADYDRGIVSSDKTQIKLEIALLNDHIQELKLEKTSVESSSTAGKYKIGAALAGGVTLIGAAAMMHSIPTSTATSFWGESLLTFSMIIAESLANPRVFWQGSTYLGRRGQQEHIPAEFYQTYAGIPLVTLASAIGSGVLYRKLKQYNQKRDARLQEIENNIARDQKIIEKLEAARG